MEAQEDTVTGMLNSACPLCGLRYASRPLLELHIREDHRGPQRRPRAKAPANEHPHPGSATERAA